eukprot:TRINITY_DN6014_c0_g1_i2.p3 TRINITY_DN6014_c0_g1~~TRINITY_DN6014_c0_g1_i2.p3  ORF type:complete len:179 (-),score=15.46 TRINITY_DN6014_c0_g1_i2:3371-3907(-)
MVHLRVRGCLLLFSTELVGESKKVVDMSNACGVSAGWVVAPSLTSLTERCTTPLSSNRNCGGVDCAVLVDCAWRSIPSSDIAVLLFLIERRGRFGYPTPPPPPPSACGGGDDGERDMLRLLRFSGSMVVCEERLRTNGLPRPIPKRRVELVERCAGINAHVMLRSTVLIARSDIAVDE